VRVVRAARECYGIDHELAGIEELIHVIVDRGAVRHIGKPLLHGTRDTVAPRHEVAVSIDELALRIHTEAVMLREVDAAVQLIRAELAAHSELRATLLDTGTAARPDLDDAACCTRTVQRRRRCTFHDLDALDVE